MINDATRLIFTWNIEKSSQFKVPSGAAIVDLWVQALVEY